MEDYTTILGFKVEKITISQTFSSLFLLHKTSSYPAMMSTVILIFAAAESYNWDYNTYQND